MFKCKTCGSIEFKLVTQPDFKGEIQVRQNEHQEIIVIANQREFIADLMFMNQFAVCACGSIQTWDYFFPNLSKNKIDC